MSRSTTAEECNHLIKLDKRDKVEWTPQTHNAPKGGDSQCVWMWAKKPQNEINFNLFYETEQQQQQTAHGEKSERPKLN